MADEFNPYYTWLAIPPEEQPPDYYRLLGVRRFETDPSVISNAATQRMSHLRTQQSGSHSKLAKQLLNEVSVARLCLLDLNQRAAYDLQLREAIRRHAADLARAEQQGGVSLTLGQFLKEVEAEQDEEHEGGPSEETGAEQRWLKVAIYLGGAVCVLAIVTLTVAVNKLLLKEPEPTVASLVFDWPADQRGGVVLMVNSVRVMLKETGPVEVHCQPGTHRIRALRQGFEPCSQTVELKAGEQKEFLPVWVPLQRQVVSASKPAFSAASSDTPTVPSPVAVSPKPTSAPEQTGPQQEMKPAPSPPAPAEPAKPTVAQANEKSRVAKEPKPAADAPSRPKAAVPDAAAQQAIAEQLKDTYSLPSVSAPADKVRLAKEMLDLSTKAHDSPTERFVLLRTAMDLAGDGGDATLMLQAIDAVAEGFVVDSLEVKGRMMVKSANEARDGGKIESIVTNSKAVIRLALLADRSDLALELADAVCTMCQRPNGHVFRKAMFDQRAEVQRLHAQWQQFQQAQVKLKASPDDATANFAVGRFHGANKQDWDAALPYLAKGSDERLRKAAQRELASPPSQPSDQIKLADAWWDAAEATDDALWKDAILLHAGQWYERGRSGLTSPVLKQKTETRLKQVTEIRSRRQP